MCAIIDPPIMTSLFSETDQHHSDFAPLKRWLLSKFGKIIVGGTKYKKELSFMRSVLGVLAEFERSGKILRVPDSEVDAEVEILLKIYGGKDFDDPHLVALVRLTKCRIVCLRDVRARRHLLDVKFYGGSAKLRPKLYTRARNSNLLCERNVALYCK